VINNVFMRSSLDGYEEWSTGLESAHNVIHAVAACDRVFAQVAVAAFHPLFLLHHANVDRIAALVQVINPQVAVQNSTGGQSVTLITRPPTEGVTADSPLRPFWTPDRGQYTSKEVAALNGLGYSYEGLEYWQFSTMSELRAHAIRLVRTLYSSSVTVASTSAVKARAENGRASMSQIRQRAGHSKRFLGTEAMSYRISVTLERSEVPKPCTVDVWVGDHQAGTSAVLGMPEMGTVKMRVPLDTAIKSSAAFWTSHAGASDMKHVIRQNLRVEIRQINGTVVPFEKVPSLLLELEEMQIMVPESNDEMPWFGEKNQVTIDLKEGQSGIS
jgi:tyrosinase